MKKVLAVPTVLCALALLAPLASATLTDVNQLGADTWQAKYSDYSDVYLPNAAGGAMLPNKFGTASIPLGSENRAIFYTTSIQPNAGPPAAWLPTNQQLTGLFYNLNLAYAAPTFVGGNLTALDLYYNQSSRNPLPGTPAGFGGVIETYVATTPAVPPFKASPGGMTPLVIPVGGASIATTNAALGATWGPNYWVEGQTTASRDSYIGSNTGPLWVSGVFVDWATLALVDPTKVTDLATIRLASGDPTLDPVFSEHLDLLTGTGSAQGDIHVMGGSFFSKLDKGDLGLGPWVDMTLVSDLTTPKVDFASGKLFPSNGTYGGAGRWPIDSQDPVTFKTAIPEPATMTLLGLGLLGIGGIRRRMKKS